MHLPTPRLQEEQLVLIDDIPLIDVEYGEDGSITFTAEGLTLVPRDGGQVFESERPTEGSVEQAVTPVLLRVRLNGRKVIAALSAVIAWIYYLRR